jgi:ribulose-phosphate 3-epimerase
MAADQLNMQKEIKTLEPYCDGFHIDIMDDHFVPNLTWGIDFIDAVNRATAKPLWVQLMVEHTARWVEKISLNANSILTFHIESSKEIRTLVNIIKKKNIIPSIAVNPKTPVERIFPFLDVIHHVVIMSVSPGFSGQPFLPEVEKKVEELLGYCSGAGIKITVGMDGGISEKNIARLAKLGVEDFAIGSAIFKKSDRVGVIKALYELCRD